jgi:Cu2+-exporting ATPase
VDESALTGESVPVTKTYGSSVFAGTRCLHGTISISVRRLAAENSISSMVTAVTAASASGSRYQDQADRVAGALLYVALTAASISFLVWLFVGRFVRDYPWSQSVVDAVTYAISVMAVSCPCPLILAVSVRLMQNTGSCPPARTG